MPMRLEVGLMVALVAALPVMAEPASCPTLVAALEAATGLSLIAPPAPDADGWCVLDGAGSTGDAVRVSAETMRLRGEVAGEKLVALEVEGTRLRVAPALRNRDMPDWLRDLTRLQSGELRLTLRRDEDADLLRVERAQLSLSGGGYLLLKGDIAGAELTAASLLSGRVTKLYLEWQNEGRVVRPVLEAWGMQLTPGATGTEAVLAARAKLIEIFDRMPDGSLLDGGREGLQDFIAALPQGRGRLLVVGGSDDGFGLVQLGQLALADDPSAPEVLARVFKGTRVSVAWTPGLVP